jgi:hypothetical protein
MPANAFNAFRRPQESPMTSHGRLVALSVDDFELLELHRVAATRGVSINTLIRRALTADGLELRGCNP